MYGPSIEAGFLPLLGQGLELVFDVLRTSWEWICGCQKLV